MSEGVAARILFGVVCALAGGAWLARVILAGDAPGRANSRLTAALRGMLLVLSGFWLLVWLGIAAIRFRYPYELEWNSGAMRDHCARLLAGQPLFTPPTIQWIPYFYTPLYVQVCAVMMKLSGGRVSFEAMRAVSIATTIGSAFLTFGWTRLLARLPRPGARNPAAIPQEETGIPSLPSALDRAWMWGVVAAGLFFAAYRMTGAWYDIERVDSLLLFFTLLGGVCLDLALRRRGREAAGFAAIAGAALALALLTKQQSLIYILAGGICLVWRRAWGLLAVFGASAAIVGLGGVWADSLHTDGWFWRYCFEVPLSQGIQRDLAIQFVFKDMLLFAPCLGIVAVSALAAFVGRDAGGTAREDRRAGAAFGFLAAAGIFVSFSSRAHWGGYENVLIPAFTFAGMAACIGAARLEAANCRASVPLMLLTLAQFLALTYRPDKQIPLKENYAAGARYLAAVRQAEEHGRVLSYDHGGFTATPRVHMLGLANLLLAKQPIPPDVKAGFLSGYYDTILVDMPPAPESDMAPLLANYSRRECLKISSSWVVTGYATPNPERQVWLLHSNRTKTAGH